MKKTAFILVFLLSLLCGAYPAAKTAAQGDFVFQAGMGFGLYNAEGDLQVPPLSITGEYIKYFNKMFPVSFGGIIAYARTDIKTATPFGYWVTTNTYGIVGFRASMHFSKLITQLPPELDLYAGGLLGWAFASVDENPAPGTPESYPAPRSKGSYFLPGLYAGSRYYFTPRFGIFGEAGFGTGYITLGITTKW